MSRFAWLALAFASAALSVGDRAVPAAAWLAPLFLLRFVRASSPVRGLAAGAAAFVFAYDLAWRGAIPFHGLTYHAFVAAIALVFFTPVLADRLLTPRLSGLARTLVFPSALVVTEFGWSSAGLGTWGVAAYSQSGELPFLQALSVTGLWGVSFLIGWCAAVANEVWEARGRGVHARRAAILLAAILAAVLVSGGLRLAVDREPVSSVRVAGITAENLEVFKGTWGPLARGKALTPAMAETARPGTLALQRELLERSRAEARHGARIVLWSEANALVLKDQEAAFVAEGQRLAKEEGIYLFMAMATITPGQPRADNKVVAIDPAGQVRDTYLKSHPTPAEASVPGDGRVRLMDTPYGRLAWAICYDFDFQALIRQAGRAGADILLDPSWDSRGMAPLHTEMAALRAIENGAALFRPVNDGLSLAVDSKGRVLAALDNVAGRGATRVMTADLPTRGVRTVYGRFGDWFAWASLMVLVGVVSLAARPAPRAASAPAGVAKGQASS